jgi:peptidoglycan LD-endopeptidase LytH
VRFSHPLPPFARALVAFAAVVVFGALLPTAHAGAADPLAEAEARVTATRRAALGAAAAYDAAQARYGALDAAITRTRQQLTSLRARQQRLSALARQRAVAGYVRAPLVIDDVVGNTTNVLDAARRAEFLDRANAKSNAAIDKLGAVTADLHTRAAAMSRQLDAQRHTVATLRSKQAEVQRSLRAAVAAEHELRARLEHERRLREYATRLARARAAAAQSALVSAPSSSSSGTAGQIIATGDWVCPVQGPTTFTDTFGAPRSGGRRHHGVDMFAAMGTPLVAVTAGSVFFQGDPLGGNAAYVVGHDGNGYYYAHLRDYVGGARSVRAGELIGHVGDSGDADGGAPHLHFEIRPGGPAGAAIDPYPTVRAHC